jgi:LPS export ABC transporter protein LptC
VVFEGYRGVDTDVELHARSAEVDWAHDEVRLQHVRILLTDEDRGPVDVAAAAGRIDLNTEGFVLDGSVVASTADGQRFETSMLRYEPERRKLVSNDPVRVAGSRLTVVGSGMELDVPTRRVRLLGPVRATTEAE